MRDILSAIGERFNDCAKLVIWPDGSGHIEYEIEPFEYVKVYSFDSIFDLTINKIESIKIHP